MRLGRSFSGGRGEEAERTSHVLADFENAAAVLHHWTVERCREDGDHFSISEESVSVLTDLVCTNDQIQLKNAAETSDDVHSETERSSARTRDPFIDADFRVRPEQIIDQSDFWVVDRFRESAQLIETVQLRTQSSVHAQDPGANQSSHWQSVERFVEHFPQPPICREPCLALFVEAVLMVDSCAFVIAS